MIYIVICTATAVRVEFEGLYLLNTGKSFTIELERATELRLVAR